MATVTLLKRSKLRLRISPGKIFGYLFLIVVTAVVMMPTIWIVSQSFMPESEILKWPIRLLPSPFTLENYEHVLSLKNQRQEMPIFRWMFNSVFVSFTCTILTLLICSLTAYPLARMEFPGRNVWLWIFGASMLIPGAVTFIPTFLITRWFGWIDTYHALIWPGMSGFFGVFFLRQFFMSIPREMEEAAIIDGCSPLQIYQHIMLPLTQSALFTLAIFTFLGSWNDFTWPLIVLNSNEMRTLTVGLTIFNGEYWSEQGIVMAGAVLTSLPVVIVYLLLQRRLAESVLLAGLAGR
jgi:multiple sugar transport system permease protein